VIGLLGLAAIAAFVWYRGWSRRSAYALCALWWAAMLPGYVTEVDGRDPAGWVKLWGAVAVFGVVAVLYGEGVRRLRQRHAPTPETPKPSGSFSDAELQRYARHILLREIGGAGQKRLKTARVLVVGAGGLGSPALLYLAGAGIGSISVIDDDVVEGSNLQRQIIHADQRIGMPKVFSAEIALRALNPFIEVKPYNRKLTEDIAQDLIADHDLVLDGTDDMDTRYLVNRACVAASVPLISGALTQWEGQLGVYDPSRGGPCYACVFPTRPEPGLVPTCAEAGVAAPLPGVIGAMMAMEAVKVLTDAGEPLRSRLMIHDALFAETRVITTKRRPDCPVCGSGKPGSAT
jgi:molybdopterin/thiamine biosynthesis adenylyltransferase